MQHFPNAPAYFGAVVSYGCKMFMNLAEMCKADLGFLTESADLSNGNQITSI
jgi:hypothetical protein